MVVPMLVTACILRGNSMQNPPVSDPTPQAEMAVVYLDKMVLCYTAAAGPLTKSTEDWSPGLNSRKVINRW